MSTQNIFNIFGLFIFWKTKERITLGHHIWLFMISNKTSLGISREAKGKPKWLFYGSRYMVLIYRLRIMDESYYFFQKGFFHFFLFFSLYDLFIYPLVFLLDFFFLQNVINIIGIDILIKVSFVVFGYQSVKLWLSAIMLMVPHKHKIEKKKNEIIDKINIKISLWLR